MPEAKSNPTQFRFRLMLLLLIVALFATIFAWQKNLSDVEMIDRQRVITNLEETIRVRERRGENARDLREALDQYKSGHFAPGGDGPPDTF